MLTILKFGGTSLADRECLRRAAEIVANHEGHVIVVLSAMGKTTDLLLAASRAAEDGDLQKALGYVAQVATAHRAAVDDESTRRLIEEQIAEATRLIEGVALLREQTSRTRALLSSFGERLCVPVFVEKLAALGKLAQAVDARQLIVTDDQHLDAQVDVEKTRKKTLAQLPAMLEAKTTPVVTGFIAATEEGVTTTLGRSGSDYTATLIGNLLQADEVCIYTDVDGILTADPRLVKEARTLDEVSYREAAEMSFFGARVVHPRTMLPAVRAKIPIRIRNTFFPDGKSTVISESSPILPGGVKTVTAIEGLALLTLEGRGMAGVVGVARRIFEASEHSETNVVMISQASSEQTVSMVVHQDQAKRLVTALEQRFALELKVGVIEEIRVKRGVAVVSIIGRGMAGTPGIAARLFSALAAVRVNVAAIAQGGSELSISVAIDEKDAARAVRAGHSTFGLTQTVHVALIGCGKVGQTLLQQLEQTGAALKDELALELRLAAISNSKRFLLDADGIAPNEALTRLEEAGARPTDAELVQQLLSQHFTDLVLVDVTAAPMAELHRLALEDGVHVVTANKKPLAEPLAVYRALMAACAKSGARYGYETTFGAGLPVLHTLRELVNTGDTLLSISGCLSGTLGFICTRLQEGADLAEAVEEARGLGYTEPDPRDDLSGMDVARKALIIARAAGIDLEPEDVELEPMVPNMEKGLVEAIAGYQGELKSKLERAEEAGEVLRYTAEISKERVRVGPAVVPKKGPIGSLSGPDNILVFRSRRYDAYPLVIQGPGAGAEVTAAGVFGDLLKVARR